AIIDYLAAMHTAWEIQESDVFVGWLPLFHDMGLTIQLLQPVYSHTHSVLFSPTDWLLKPHILFEAVHRFNGTITWMPNFAFNFCLRHVRDEQLAGMDLSSWRILGCASEPVQIESLNAFAARFDEFGLDPNSLMVAYGLAENIAAVSITPLETSPNVDWVSDAGLQSLKAKAIPPESDGARALASCGYPIPSTQISVVDDRGQDLEDRQVGNVLVKSPYMFDSYYQLPQETNESMQEGWLWTGDLGYMLNGELYICGRKKELIIVRGRNLLPHHIEEIAAAVLGKNLRYSVAFGIEDTSSGTEAPVLVCEMRQAVTPEQSAEMEKSIREEVNQILQIHLEDVRFEEKGWIAKTTSGKINHIANREKYLKEIGEREAITLSTQNKLSREFSAIEETLFHIWSQLLKTTAIGMQDDFFKLGGDSLAAAELILEVEAQFGIHLPSNLLFERISFSEMAQYIDQGAQMAPEKIAVAIQPIEEHSDRIPFFCVHAINGNVLGYWRLSKLLGQHQPFYGLQAHGLNGLGRPDRRVEIMARRYIDAIREIQPQGPYSLGGYCFGGLVAYEMALQLREAGEKIKDVIIIDFHAPRNDSNLSSILEEFERLSNLLAHLPSEWRKYKMLDRDQKQARRQRIVGRLKKRFQQLKGEQIHLSVEDTFDPEEFSPTRLRIDGAIVEAYYHYQPKPYPGPVTLLRTKRAPIELDKSLGWKRLSQNGIEIIDLPGSHETVLNQPYVETLAEKL
ncbi:MAG: non-ribosomal peptide synthetase, partial [Anaerolineae bacterium]|nr:non-ribosomal peptide synthetase [Anaerolineae bacterium]